LQILSESICSDVSPSKFGYLIRMGVPSSPRNLSYIMMVYIYIYINWLCIYIYIYMYTDCVHTAQ
jgi:hypothetical protein